MKIFTPTEYANSIYAIDMQLLKEKGIKLILLDIDNTLVSPRQTMPTDSVISWIKTVKSDGFIVVLFSNNSKRRINLFNEKLNLHTVHRALKPLAYHFIKTARKFCVSCNEMCLIGDQVFTDIWGANNAGVMSVLVMPISPDEGASVKLKRLFEKRVIKHNKVETYCLIGNPLAHSKSPILHEQVYSYYNINARYLLFPIEQHKLGQIISKFRKIDVKGFNVTVPFKQAIMPFLDEISDIAQTIGSVNTVVEHDGKWIGYNTDADGFIMMLKSNETAVAGSRVKILGAGGSTPAIVYAVLQEGAKSVFVYNRTISKAQQIAQKFKNVVAMPIDKFDPQDCDILINTTSVGLAPNVYS
ncbi:MAG: YqeG family HAD IIIA-type phosphatase [Clostridiaceae bacterium]|nr:YqeG family HAD IIIA-type phosphatase [Clostridiaceae bacterium]